MTKSHAAMLGPYKLQKTIGEGEFGKVKLAVHSRTGAEVAIKLCKKQQVIAMPNGYTKLMREISTLKMVRSHRYIISLIEVIETDAYIAIVMYLAKGGELFEYILTSRCLNETESRKLFAQIICAVGFIHSIGIVHRDLKLENILLDENQNVLVTDFGFANKSLGPNEFLRTSCGSPCYAAPELVTKDGYVGESADIWSCGVILFSMIAGYLPYDDDPENPDGDNINLLYNYIMETKLNFPDYVPQDCQSLINRILVPDPQYRADISEIMDHVWLKPVRYIFENEMERRKKLGHIPVEGPGFAQNSVQAPHIISNYVPLPDPLEETLVEPMELSFPIIDSVVPPSKAHPIPPTDAKYEPATDKFTKQDTVYTMEAPAQVEMMAQKSEVTPEPVNDEEDDLMMDYEPMHGDSPTLAAEIAASLQASLRNSIANPVLDAPVSNSVVAPATIQSSASGSTLQTDTQDQTYPASKVELDLTVRSNDSDTNSLSGLGDNPLTQIPQGMAPLPEAESISSPNDEFAENFSFDGSRESSFTKPVIPRRSSSMDDSLVYVDGNTLHADDRGIASPVLSRIEKELPPIPYTDNKERLSLPSATQSTTQKSAFAAFMTSSQFSATLEGEPKGILRGSMGSRSSGSKKVSIEEPTKTMNKKANWFATLNPFKKTETPANEELESPRALTQRAGSVMGMFRTNSQSQVLNLTSPAPQTYGLPTEKYEDSLPAPAPIWMQFRSMTLASRTRGTTENQDALDPGVSGPMEMTRFASPTQLPLPVKAMNKSVTPMSHIQGRPMTLTSNYSPPTSIDGASEEQTLPFVDMIRSSTVLSLSASEYHVQLSLGPNASNGLPEVGLDAKKMKTYIGTADRRAISQRSPESLLADLEVMFEQRGFEVATRYGEQKSEYRLKITRPGYLIRGETAEDSRSGVSVSVDELSKFIDVPRELKSQALQTGFVPLPPSVSRSISKNAKLKQATKISRMLSGLPTSLAKKIKYVKEYGVNYNAGFSPKTTSSSVGSPQTKAEASNVRFVDELIFYVELQKVANLPGVCVVTFKRVRGNIWSFKTLYNALVEELPLL